MTINYRKYFAFSSYKQSGQNVTSFCDKTLPGWSHDVLGHNWACFTGKRTSGSAVPKVHRNYVESTNGVFRQNPEAIRKINSIQSLWSARHYPQFEGKPLSEIYRMKGGPKSRIIRLVFHILKQDNIFGKQNSNWPCSSALLLQHLLLMIYERPPCDCPKTLTGEILVESSYVSPVRNQGRLKWASSFSTLLN